MIRDGLNAFLQPEPASEEEFNSMPRLTELPEIWTSVKKTKEVWDCKDPSKSIKNFWGFYEINPTVTYNDEFQKFTHNFEDQTRTFKNGTTIEYKDGVKA